MSLMDVENTEWLDDLETVLTAVDDEPDGDTAFHSIYASFDGCDVLKQALREYRRVRLTHLETVGLIKNAVQNLFMEME